MLYNKKPGQKRKNKIDRLFEDQKALMQREYQFIIKQQICEMSANKKIAKE